MRSLAKPVQLGNATLVVVMALLLAGCDRSFPTSPTPADSEPSTSTVGSVRIDFDRGITGADKDTVETSIAIAHDYFQRQFQHTLLGPITVSVWNADGPFAVKASGGSGTIIVYVQHRSWQALGRMQRIKLVVHEMFHMLQDEVDWPGAWGGWLQEGSAAFVADAAVIDAGMAGIDEVRQCQISNYFDFDGPSAGPLEQLSFEGGNPTSSRYVIAWLAWDRLLDGPAGTPKLAVYWTSGFRSAFGLTPQSFSRDFEQYRGGLQPPNDSACTSLDSR